MVTMLSVSLFLAINEDNALGASARCELLDSYTA